MSEKQTNTSFETDMAYFLVCGLFAILLLPIAIISLSIYILVKIFKIKGLYALLIAVVIGLFNQFILKNSLENYLQIILDNILKGIDYFKESESIIESFKFYILSFPKITWIWHSAFGILFAGLGKELADDKERTKKYLKSPEQELKEREERKNESKISSFQNKKLEKSNHGEDKTLIGATKKGLVFIQDNAKHILVAGTTGSGKTVALVNFMESALEKKYGLFAIDGKGSLLKGSMLHYLQELCNKHNRKLYVINLVDPEKSHKYNPFKNSRETEAKDMLIQMSNWTEEHYKVNTERYLQRLIKILHKANIEISLTEIAKYTPDKFQILVTELEAKGTITTEELTSTLDIIKTTGDIANSAMARYATTAESEAGEIFSSEG